VGRDLGNPPVRFDVAGSGGKSTAAQAAL